MKVGCLMEYRREVWGIFFFLFNAERLPLQSWGHSSGVQHFSCIKERKKKKSLKPLLPGWDAPWVAALPGSSQAGAVIPHLHLWALGCPRPDLAAACRECTREAPLWNRAISSKLLAEAAWLCCLSWPGGHPSAVPFALSAWGWTPAVPGTVP